MCRKAHLRFCRIALPALLTVSGTIGHGYAQRASGMTPFNRLGIAYQKAVGVDVGLLAYHTRYGYQRGNFYDLSLGVESIFAKRFTFVPKINADAGFRSSLFEGATVGGGVDIGWQTDFSSAGLRITPKTGLTWGSFLRLYYGFHVYSPGRTGGRISPHRLSIELNIAAIHDLKRQ